MKRIISSFAALSLMCLLSISSVFADHKLLSEHVNFNTDFIVHDTTVKSGYYKLIYDTEAKTLRIMDGEKLVAEVKATLKVNAEKAEHDVVYAVETSGGRRLQSVKFGGQHEEVVIDTTS
jgi:hypothetical protein